MPGALHSSYDSSRLNQPGADPQAVGSRPRRDALPPFGVSGRFTFALAGLLSVSIAGCGEEAPEDTIPIRGTVTYKGAPVKGGTVLYQPVGMPTGGSTKTQKKSGDVQGRIAIGSIQPDGSFTMHTSAGMEGVVPGEYQIAVRVYEADLLGGDTKTVEKTQVEIPVVPEKYLDPTTSGLTDTVNEQHSGEKNIILED